MKSHEFVVTGECAFLVVEFSGLRKQDYISDEDE